MIIPERWNAFVSLLDRFSRDEIGAMCVSYHVNMFLIQPKYSRWNSTVWESNIFGSEAYCFISGVIPKREIVRIEMRFKLMERQKTHQLCNERQRIRNIILPQTRISTSDYVQVGGRICNWKSVRILDTFVSGILTYSMKDLCGKTKKNPAFNTDHMTQI